MKSLVVYFSTSGVTANIAKGIADSINANLFEIKPENPYVNSGKKMHENPV